MNPAVERKALLLHSAYTTDLDDIMGFEELAALKQQLSKRTQAAKPERADTQDATRAAAAPDGPSDAGRQVPRHARRQAPGPHGADRPGVSRGPRPGAAAAPDGKAPAPAGARPDGEKPRNRNDRRGERRGERGAGERGDERTAASATPRGAARQDGKRQTTPVEPVVITIGQLQKRFPKAFPKNPLPKVPLKLGISKDLVAQASSLALSEAELLEAIKVWCQGNRYWSSMTKDAPRVNLAGDPEGTVTPEQASRARSLSATHRRGKRPAPKKTEPATPMAASMASDASSSTDQAVPSTTSVDVGAERSSSPALTQAIVPAVAASVPEPSEPGDLTHGTTPIDVNTDAAPDHSALV